MRSRLGRRALLWGVGALAGCAAGGATPGEFDAAACAEMTRRPDQYVNGEARAFLVSRDGRAAGLLWGTFHVRYGEATMLPRAIRDRFAAASSLSVEHELEPTRRARAAAFLRPDPAALARLDPGTKRALDEAGLPSDAMGKRSLLGLAAALNARSAAVPAGVLPSVGFVDADLVGFARSVSIPVRVLEEVDAALAAGERTVFAEPNGDAGAAALRLALRRQPGAAAFWGWVRERYAAGEVGTMTAGLAGWRADVQDLLRYDQCRAALLTERNAAWMPRLEAALGEGLDAGKPAFAAFGAAHLPGTDGVVALLRARGWAVAGCVRDRCAA